MKLSRLSIVNYRNIAGAEIELSSGINCFVGQNGAGKTNVLDCIYFLSFCKSFFGLGDTLNIRHDEPFFVIQGQYDISGSTEEIYCGVKRGTKKQFKRNKKEYQRIADHIGLLPLVIISPNDELLISDGAEMRRKYADSVISQCDTHYMDSLLSYNKLLAQRNALLKQMAQREQQSPDLLDIFDQQLSRHSRIIADKRRCFVEELRPMINKYHHLIAGGNETIGVTYRTELDKSDLYEILVATRRRDMELGYTSHGTHKDDIALDMDSYQIKKVGSQGQKKTFVIALKLAQYNYLSEQKKCTPLLLLDDVFDKLDSERGDKLIGLMASDCFGQIFITDTNMGRLQTVLEKTNKEYRIFSVEKGNIEAVGS